MGERIGQHMTAIKQERPPTRKTDSWIVNDRNDGTLGMIQFYPRWRCYIFQPCSGCVFNAGCLEAMARFLNDATKAWKDGTSV